MRAFFSVLGMYNHEEEVFEHFRTPTGVDRTVAIHKILFDNAELGLIYTDPDIFPTLIKNWTDTNYPSWERAYDALMAEYNPIHNYDRREEWTDEIEGSGSVSETGSNSGNEEHADTEQSSGERDQTNHSVEDKAETIEKTTDVTHLVAGYNQGNADAVYDYNDAGHDRTTDGVDDVIDSTEHEEYTETKTISGSSENTGSYSKSGTESNSKTADHSGRMYGNIGVTTSQQMIEQEMELRLKFNIYDMISMSFRSNFCIMVY